MEEDTNAQQATIALLVRLQRFPARLVLFSLKKARVIFLIAFRAQRVPTSTNLPLLRASNAQQAALRFSAPHFAPALASIGPFKPMMACAFASQVTSLLTHRSSFRRRKMGLTTVNLLFMRVVTRGP